MKHDINGWQVLQKHLNTHREPQKVLNRVFGDDFDTELLACGAHLISADHARQLVGELKLNPKNADEFYNRVITSRCGAGCDHHLEEFKRSACELAQKSIGAIPCAEIDILWHFQPLNETLQDFMKRVAIASFQVNCPPGCCAFRVTDCRMTAKLALPTGSLIIVSGIKPAAADELALFQCRNRRLILGKSQDFDPGRIKWTAPVIQLRIGNCH